MYWARSDVHFAAQRSIWTAQTCNPKEDGTWQILFALQFTLSSQSHAHRLSVARRWTLNSLPYSTVFPRKECSVLPLRLICIQNAAFFSRTDCSSSVLTRRATLAYCWIEDCFQSFFLLLVQTISLAWILTSWFSWHNCQSNCWFRQVRLGYSLASSVCLRVICVSCDSDATVRLLLHYRYATTEKTPNSPWRGRSRYPQ